MRDDSLSYRELLGLPLGANLKTHKTYRTWAGMHSRVGKKWHHAYGHYQSLGVFIDPRWCGARGFAQFLADMGHPPTPKHTLERKCNEGPYGPDNCVWATYAEQNRNKRDTHKVATPNGFVSAAEAARLYGLHPHTVYRRIQQGLRGDAVIAPAKPRKNHA
jgi:hypothetical protein